MGGPRRNTIGPRGPKERVRDRSPRSQGESPGAGGPGCGAAALLRAAGDGVSSAEGGIAGTAVPEPRSGGAAARGERGGPAGGAPAVGGAGGPGVGHCESRLSGRAGGAGRRRDGAGALPDGQGAAAARRGGGGGGAA